MSAKWVVVGDYAVNMSKIRRVFVENFNDIEDTDWYVMGEFENAFSDEDGDQQITLSKEFKFRKEALNRMLQILDAEGVF